MIRSLGAVLISLFILVTVLYNVVQKEIQPGKWQEVDENFEVAEFQAPGFSDKRARFTVVRIDPALYEFDLYCAAEHGDSLRTIDRWCRDFNLLAAVNAGMFQEDGLTNVGFMVHRGRKLNPGVLKNYNAFLGLHPVPGAGPPVTVFDRTCGDLDSLLFHYRTVVQNLRMISCQRRNTWKETRKRWSAVALGRDANGRILFLFSRYPMTMHEFADNLLRLPLKLRTTMYLEGGPEASLCVRTKKGFLLRVGSFETGFYESNDNRSAWPLPNVIGVRKRTASPP